MFQGGIPASAYAQVCACGDDVYQAVVGRQLPEYLRCAVGRMVVDDNDVVSEARLLRQRRAYGIGNGA